MVSFGPIHHGGEGLEQGEHYKRLWTSKFAAEYGKKTGRDTNEATQYLLKRIECIEELKELFSEDALGLKYKDNYNLVWLLFVDGCSLLHFMENVDEHNPNALNLMFDQLMYMWSDILLLENQLPITLLKMLSKEKGTDLEYLLKNQAGMGKIKREKVEVKVTIQNQEYIHILHYFRYVFLETDDNNNACEEMAVNIDPSYGWHTYNNITDLKAVGIRVTANKKGQWAWSNISFTSKWLGGELSLPVYLFNKDATPYFFWNLIAYEMCPDVICNYECCSLFSFMDSLIDTAEDVKELRLAGVFINFLGSNQDLANLFNDLGGDLRSKMYSNTMYTQGVAYDKRYIILKKHIQQHYQNKWKVWLALGYNTYFSTPWAMIAFFAASVALILTFIQTWFTMFKSC
ncbi:hypothetical protein RJT34_25452 [Clitoria ternatea]|uniref:Uncharacterized protein n=1 Tax=Clitoria ternatea TaxID=43366 RepID=A0AAN9IGV6_CLITE